MGTFEFDVIVCGGGTAGASAAYHLARAGLKVVILEGRERKLAGAQWVNGVPLWMFERAGLPWPQEPELRENNPEFSLRAPGGQEVMRVVAPIANIDMRFLSRRLLDLAQDAGVEIWDQTEVLAPVLQDSKVVGVKYRKQRTEGELHARLVIDALNGKRVLINELPDQHFFPAVQAYEMCDASQQIRKITDLEQAQAYLDRVKGQEKQVISFLAIEGGWSVLNVQVNLKSAQVEFLSGAIAEAHLRSGAKIIQDFVESNSGWIGETLMSGRGKIPLRATYDQPFTKGYLCIGGAACMVFPIHGSGIGPAMIAGKLLAEALGQCSGIEDEKFGPLFKKLYDSELGHIQKFYAGLQRITQSLTTNQAKLILRSPLNSRIFIEAGFAEKWPLPHPKRMSWDKIINLFKRGKK